MVTNVLLLLLIALRTIIHAKWLLLMDPLNIIARFLDGDSQSTIGGRHARFEDVDEFAGVRICFRELYVGPTTNNRPMPRLYRVLCSIAHWRVGMFTEPRRGGTVKWLLSPNTARCSQLGQAGEVDICMGLERSSITTPRRDQFIRLIHLLSRFLTGSHVVG